MNLTLIKPDRLFTTVLPDEVTGRHWIRDNDNKGQPRQLVCIEGNDGSWVMSAIGKVSIADEQKELDIRGGLIHLRYSDSEDFLLLAENPQAVGKTYTKVGFADDTALRIGSDQSCSLCFDCHHLSPLHALLFYENEIFSIKDTSSEGGVYVNGLAAPKNDFQPLKFGDKVFILGLSIIIGKRFIAYNNPNYAVRLLEDPIQVAYSPQVYEEPDTELNSEDGADPDHFFRSPRIRRDIIEKTIKVEEPPSKEKPEESPTILKVGPSVGMALGSAMMGIYMVTNAVNSGNYMRAVPMGCMMVVMILGAILWPNLTRRYEKRKAKKAESKRRAAYAAYLDKIRIAIAQEIERQKEIFTENRVTLHECLERVANKDRRLFERTTIHPDFLELRIGKGNMALLADVQFPDEKLQMEEDALRDLVAELEERPRVVENVPISMALTKDFVAGVVGRREDCYPFMRGLLAQLTTLYAPDEVRVVFLGDTEEQDEWNFVRFLPHIFDDGFEFRYLATNSSEATEVSMRLERELNNREGGSNRDNVGDFGAYYVIFVANQALAKSSEMLDSINALRVNKGFSVLTFAEELRKLPKECTSIIELDGANGKIYDPKDSTGQHSLFVSDISLQINTAELFAEELSSIHFSDLSEQHSLPSALGFLEMFEVGKVEHLNIKNRWAESNPMLTLGVPLGIDPQGSLSILDAHEDAHGPHGLFAGMTGSGKSETIITYILSLAVNFRPDEVSFVLIDYKGGGLAGAFDNSRARLPHLSGTITNLDGSAITRSMISIQSELKRRQAMFNEARDISSAGTMDIYKYQDLFRKGVVKEACPHLFIISDEFAELKSQQPEFMDQLISTARIGRSLGVHLLLATQKPSGVVSDQIWSNARFKVCLKVADAADSKEMLKRDDAASITASGRYYLQVGYNEYFAMGQSAYGGTTYRPTEHFERKKDDSVVMVSSTGRPLASVSPPKQQTQDTKTPESVIVLDHLVEVASKEGISAPQLWLDPIPPNLTFADLNESYPEQTKDHSPLRLSPIIGEYDDPFIQVQGLLRIPLSEEGNVVVYGSAGSGKASLLTAMLYSLIRDYPVEAVNAYIMDFGAETLGAFKGAPQVGDIVFANDEEKVVNLLRMLESEVENRRKLLSNFGGSLELFNKAVTNPTDWMPAVVVMANNYDIFAELYERYVDRLTKLTRDGVRYGIYFVLTCTRSGSVNYRMLPNFKQRLVLKMNNKDDYLGLLGSMRDVSVPTAYARGLVKMERMLEFQTAALNADEETNEFEAIMKAIEDLGFADDAAQARVIPTLPDLVTSEMLIDHGVSRSAMPLGISKETFEVVCQDFQRVPCLFITGDDEDRQALFIEPFIKVLGATGNLSIKVFDPAAILVPSRLPQNETLEVFQDQDAINSFLDSQLKDGTELDSGTFFVIVSLRDFLDALSSEVRTAFTNYVTSNSYKNLGGVVLSGDPARFTTFNYDAWYKEMLTNSTGIWTSNGLSNQSMLRLTRQIPEFREPLPDSFAWHVSKGNAVLIKQASCKS